MTLPGTVLAVVGAKGGVGKTTTSLTLTAALAGSGHSTIAVELDIGMANFVDFLDIDGDVEEGPTLHDVLANEAQIESACYRVTDDFHVGPSGTDLTDYAETSLDRLPEIVATLRDSHDVVVLDTPAGMNEETMRALQVADRAILVSTPRTASVRNVRNTIELTERVDTRVQGLVLTKSGTGASPGADRIAEFLSVDLLGHVPDDDAVPHSQDNGEPLTQYAPRSSATIAYRRIASKLVEDEAQSHEQDATGWKWVGERDRSDDGETAPTSGDRSGAKGTGERRETDAGSNTDDDPQSTPESATSDGEQVARSAPPQHTDAGTDVTAEHTDSRSQRTTSSDDARADGIGSVGARPESDHDQAPSIAADNSAGDGSAVRETDRDTVEAKPNQTSVGERIRSFLGL